MLPELNGESPVSESEINNFWNDGFVVLRNVLNEKEIKIYGEIIRNASMEKYQAKNMELSFEGGLLQTLNLRMDSKDVAEFSHSKRLASIAAKLLKVEKIRIYFDQALFKAGGCKETFWHQDQYFWPLATNLVIGLWMPLVNCNKEMGAMRFAKGSHVFGDLYGPGLSSESQKYFDEIIHRKKLEVFQVEEMNAGDATFHFGWTVHGAPENSTQKMREAIIISYFEDGTRLSELDNPSRKIDAEFYLGGKQFNELADSSLNIIVN